MHFSTVTQRQVGRVEAVLGELVGSGVILIYNTVQYIVQCTLHIIYHILHTIYMSYVSHIYI